MALINTEVRVVPTKYGTYQLQYRNPYGRRRRLSAGGDKAAAQRMAYMFSDWLRDRRDPEVELANERRRETARTISLREYFPVFMSRHGSQRRPKTQESYRNSFRNICRCPQLADVRLHEVHKGIVLDYVNARIQRDEVTPASVNREIALLKVMFSCAIEWDILERNPLRNLRMLKEAPKRNVRLTPGQAAELLKLLPEPIADIVEFAIYSGYRKEAILGLKIDNVAIAADGSYAEVTHAQKGSKDESGLLGRNAVTVLTQAIGRRKTGYVFVNPRTKTRYVSIHKTFNRAVRKLGLEVNGTKFRFHDLRHVFVFNVNYNFPSTTIIFPG